MLPRRDKRGDLHLDGLHVPTDPHRLAEVLADLRRRSAFTLRDRAHQVRFNLVLAVQAGLAAGLAWVIAYNGLQNPDPVFAPISAVGTLAASVGQRFRRTVELVAGVVIGIAVGNVLIFVFRTGAWQMAVIVTLAILLAIFLGAGPGVVTQAAATGILLVALTPQDADLEFTRVVDALVGGAVGLAVALLLLPFNPLRVVDRAARPALETLANELALTARALSDGDVGLAHAALDRVQQVEEHMAGLKEALEGGRETATLAPARRHRRGALSQYVESAEFIDHAVADSGTLIRRAVTLLEDREVVPRALPSAVAHLSAAVRLLLAELGEGREPDRTRERVLRAVADAGTAYADGVGFSGSVVVAQIRTTASDLLRATGLERVEANRLVRRAADAGREQPTGPGAG